MKKYLTIAKVAGAFLALAALLSLPACKGRTSRNVAPSGETVEVVIPVDSVSSL